MVALSAIYRSRRLRTSVNNPAPIELSPNKFTIPEASPVLGNSFGLTETL